MLTRENEEVKVHNLHIRNTAGYPHIDSEEFDRLILRRFNGLQFFLFGGPDASRAERRGQMGILIFLSTRDLLRQRATFHVYRLSTMAFLLFTHIRSLSLYKLFHTRSLRRVHLWTDY